jgi:hypothetical protein
MQHDLAAALPPDSYHLDVKDVDLDPAARIRWGLKVPVLLFEEVLVCYGRLDALELRQALAPSRR